MECSARARRGGRRSFRGATMLSMKARRRGEARGRGRGRSPRPGRWVRRVRVLGGRRCCAGSSPWTSFSARAAAAGGGSWGCTRGACACGSCSSGSGSGSPRHPRSRRARRRDGERSRTRPSSRHSLAGSGPLAVVCLPSSFWLWPLPTSSLRGHGSRRIAALLSTAEGHRPARTLAFALRGTIVACGGKGERLAAANGLWNSYALQPTETLEQVCTSHNIPGR
jgi:hypothetical protein